MVVTEALSWAMAYLVHILVFLYEGPEDSNAACSCTQAPLCLSILQEPPGWAAACTVPPTCLTSMLCVPSCLSPQQTHWEPPSAHPRPAHPSHAQGYSLAGHCVAHLSCLTSYSGVPYPPS